MAENLPVPNREEALRAENEYLKMKLMLENGAQFAQAGEDCPPELENLFLKSVMEFEKQFENESFIKIFDRIGRPDHFRPVDQIPDEEIHKATTELLRYLEKHQISLAICSPNVSCREIYRFITEELFEEEMADVQMPDMLHCFTYDEYHPDPVFENSNTAVEACIREILTKTPMEWMPHFRKDKIQLNDCYPLTDAEFRARVNRFKSFVDEVHTLSIRDEQSIVDGKDCFVKGQYEWDVTIQGERLQFAGSWLVNFEYNSELGYWMIFSVRLDNLIF
jgi:hypothetical protein